MNNTGENKLLIAIAARSLALEDPVIIKSSFREDVDWKSFISRALNEGLLPLLYRQCRDLNLLSFMPEWAREDLHQSYRQTAFQNLLFLKFIEELGETLQRNNLPVIILKGASLLNIVYTDIGLRPMEDIDLMVHPKDLKGLKILLEDMGLVRDKVYPNTYVRGIIHVDLHTDFLSTHRIRSREGLLKIQSDKVWQRAGPFMEKEVPLYRLSTYDNLIALSFHILKHHFSRLIWFADIKGIIKSHDVEFDWLDIAAYSRNTGAERCLLYVMLLTKHLLGLKVPDDALKALGKGRLSIIEKYILRIRMANEPMGRLSLFLYLFQIKKMSQKFFFIREYVIPRKEVMNQIFPSSTSHRSPQKYILRTLDILLNGIRDLFWGAKAIFKGSLPRI